MERVTLQTVADRVGVSRATVSNAFSRPDQLSEDLRQRILAAADDLGYAGPDPAGRALARGSAGAVGVLLGGALRYAFADEVAALFVGAVADELDRTGLALTLFSTNENDGAVPARDIALDGAIVYSSKPEAPAISWLRRRRLPLVFVDQPRESGIASVNVDDRGGARSAAQHLLDLGHRDIAVLTPGGNDPTAYVERQRLLGWRDALEPAGASVTVIAAPHPGMADAAATAPCPFEVLAATSPRPTAALCYSDAIAVQLVNDALAAGAKVPADLSVVGFDDGPLAGRMRPALTTVRQDVEAKGRAAASTLVAALDQRDHDARIRHAVLPAELVVRDSTGPARRRRTRR